MGKQPKKNGWVNRLLRPFTQHITLTEPGKKQAPMRKGKVAKKAVKKTVKKVPRPLSTKERQVKELKTMYDIGVKDPERLARIISRMLQEANMQDEKAQLKFERLVWEKAEKRGDESEDKGDA